MRTGIDRLLRHPIATSLAWLAIERGVQILMGIAIAGALARHLGVAVFGRWQYALSVTMVAMSFTWLCGAEVLVPRLSTASQEQAETLLGTAFTVRLVNGLLVAAFVAGLALLGGGSPEVVVFLVGLTPAIVFREAGLVGFAWLQSRTYVKPALLINIAAVAVKAAVIVLLSWLDAPLIWFALAWSGETLLMTIALTLFARARYGHRWRFERARVLELITPGVVLWLGLISVYALQRIDRLVLQRVVDPETFGLYAAAAQLNENWLAVGTMLAQTCAPTLVYAASSDAHGMRNVRRLTLLTLPISMVGAAVLYAIAPYVIGVVFGGRYLGAVELFRKLVWLAVILNAEAMLNTVLLKRGASGWFAAKWALGLGVAAATCLALAPRLGPDGAIASLYAGAAVVLAVTLAYVARPSPSRPDALGTRSTPTVAS